MRCTGVVCSQAVVCPVGKGLTSPRSQIRYRGMLHGSGSVYPEVDYSNIGAPRAQTPKDTKRKEADQR
jgi:hypothetical protein